MSKPVNYPRRQAIPVLYTSGTHYEVGFDVSLASSHYLVMSQTGARFPATGYKNIKFLNWDTENIGGNIPRRSAIPILYTRGTYYDVGFDVGRTFGSLIKSFLELSASLNEHYLPLFNTPAGHEAYIETLEACKKSFPQYIQELQGIADGAKVEFHKLFLLHLDDIPEISIQNKKKQGEGSGKPPITKRTGNAVGCTTITVNRPACQVIGHTEDALSEALNHFYYVSAHIISDTPQGKHKVKEERFMSLCYAGHLPGYTMSYNHHGLVCCINTMSHPNLQSGKIPRHILSRALLAAENYDDAIKILQDCDVGCGDGCSFNVTFINDQGPEQKFYNIEMAPQDGPGSELDIKEIPSNDVFYHANKYLRIPTRDYIALMVDSSIERMNTLTSFEKPESEKDVRTMLGDTSNPPHTVFRDDGTAEEVVKTIAVGLFNIQDKTLSIYSDNPKTHEPQCVLPLVLKKT